MAEVKWVKLTTDMFDNRKIKHLRRLPDGNNIVLIWVMLLTMAGRCNSGGMIFLTENIPYTPKMLANELDFEESTVTLALQSLEQLDMIVTENGFFSISGWEEYQNIDKLAEIREQNRERKRLQRARQKQALLDDVSQDSHVTVTGCHALEEEKEEDKEKESHSFNHSAAEEGESDDEITSDALQLKYMGGTLGQGIVLMSDEQFGDLCDKLSLDELHKYFDVITECEKNGKHFKKKSHYQAILDMAAKDRRINK
jgi:predicted phage replisome organizer